MNLIDLYTGDGSDGNITFDNTNPTVFARDMMYGDVSFGAGADVNPNGFKLLWNGTFDMANMPAGAIHNDGNSGGNASGAAAGTIAALKSGQFGLPSSAATQTAPAGGAGNGQNRPANPVSGLFAAGIQCGDVGAAGNGATTTGGASVSQAAATFQDGPSPATIVATIIQGLSVPINTGGTAGETKNMQTGMPGLPGSSGGGGTAGLGGGGGGQPTAAGPICLLGNILNRDGTTAAGAVRSRGGKGGKGGNAPGTNAGGGSGAPGAPGGLIVVGYNSLTGSTATGVFDVSGGDAGDSGNGTGTGTGADGSGPGAGGRVIEIDLSTASVVSNTLTTQTRNAGGAHSGTTAGSAGIAAVAQVSL